MHQPKQNLSTMGCKLVWLGRIFIILTDFRSFQATTFAKPFARTHSEDWSNSANLGSYTCEIFCYLTSKICTSVVLVPVLFLAIENNSFLPSRLKSEIAKAHESFVWCSAVAVCNKKFWKLPAPDRTCTSVLFVGVSDFLMATKSGTLS